MKLSDVDGYKETIYGFLKFKSNRKHLESLQKGNLYMNNFKYFIDLEANTGIKGMGDRLEVSAVMSNLDLSIYDSETNEHLGDAFASSMNFRFDTLQYKPVFCLFTITSDMLEIIDENEEIYRCRLFVSEEEKEEMIRNFGEYVLYINPGIFGNQVSDYLKENGYGFARGMVKYSDFKINNMDRLNAYFKQDSELFFYKDILFKNQSEYRIVILNKDVEDKLEINIGDLSSNSIIYDSEELLGGNFGMEIRKDNENRWQKKGRILAE